MAQRLLVLAFGLVLILLSGPSLAESYKDGYAAYRRGDHPRAFQIWKNLADRGDRSAQHGLGELYSSGQGVPRNEVEAAKWYRLSALGGYVPAQFRLAAIYEEGRGVPKNMSLAMKWYRKAAQQGSLPARTSLGLIYVTGRGVPKNDYQAVKWFQLAAEQGDALAQYNLGLIFARGVDVLPKDDLQALIWFIVAENGGNAEAGRHRRSLAARLSPEQTGKAEKQARDWITSKAQDKAAKCSMLGLAECN